MTAESQKSSRLLAYLQLMRLPNVFTAMADIFMGFWLTHETLSPVGVFVLLLISSSCLYTAGMVLNDVFDEEQDRRERPQRPIPSGRVPRTVANRLGWSLICCGIAAGWGTATIVGQDLPGIMVIILAGCILLYDRFAKQTPGGPVSMGFCRVCNVMLGMSAWPMPIQARTAPLQTAHGIIALGIGTYVAGVTLFARREAVKSRQNQLITAFLVMLAGMVMLWWFPKLLPPAALISMFQSQPFFWVLLWLILAILIGWRFVSAIIRPEPALVQAAVKSGILSIIVLDAVVVFAVRGCWPAIAVLLLLVPAIVLGRWVYST